MGDGIFYSEYRTWKTRKIQGMTDVFDLLFLNQSSEAGRARTDDDQIMSLGL